MPIGQADWSRSGQSANVGVGLDTSELAVRLGSSVNFDRTGKVLFQDNFTRLDGLWSITSLGISAAPAVQNAIAEYYDSALSFALVAGSGNFVRMQRRFRSWRNTRLSLEVSAHHSGAPSMVYFNIWKYDGTNVYTVRFQLITGCTVVQYMDNTGNFVTLDTLSPAFFFEDHFHTLKIDFDGYLHEYVRLRLDELTYDMAGIPLFFAPSTELPRLQLDMYFYGMNLVVNTWYVDHVIITEDE